MFICKVFCATMLRHSSMSDVVISRIIIVRQESVFRYDQFVLNIRINIRAKLRSWTNGFHCDFILCSIVWGELVYVLGRSVYIEAAGVVQDHKYIKSEESVAAPPSRVLIACLNTDHGRRPLLLGVLAFDMTRSRSGRRVAVFTCVGHDIRDSGAKRFCFSFYFMQIFLCLLFYRFHSCFHG